MIIKQILEPIDFTKYNDTSRIEYIVIHFFGALGTALGVAEYFEDYQTKSSAHYNVDEFPIIYQSVKDGDAAWHCGGTYIYHPKCRNKNSIGIEVRPRKIDVKSLKETDLDWYFDEATILNVLELVSSLMSTYNVPIENVLRHYDITHKLCPRPFVGNDINTYYKKTGNQMWQEFKQRLQNRRDVEEMDISKLTDEQVDLLIERITLRLSSKKVSDYALNASKAMVTNGIFADGDGDGFIDNPQGFVKRQDLAVVLTKLKLIK